MKTLTLFNNKGGVGKTALVYHLAWMFAELGVSVLAADLDPQANLTNMFLPEERVLSLWEPGLGVTTLWGGVETLWRGVGDVRAVTPVRLSEKLSFIPGELGLSRFEDSLSESWGRSFGGDERSFRIQTAFHRMLAQAADETGSELVLLDVGPNLGAINRASLLSSDTVVFPVAPDLFSLQGLKNLGPTLIRWREDWKNMVQRAPSSIDLPTGDMQALGYVVLQHGVYSQKVVKAYAHWAQKIPQTYRECVLNLSGTAPPLDQDPQCLARLKHYKSLMPLAMEARKPIFFLKTADGALGAHLYAVQDCYLDFKQLAEAILERVGGF